MQGLPKLVDRCADDFISSFHRDWLPDESGAEYDYRYGEAILKTLSDFETRLRAEVRRRIATRLRRRNAYLPISKLPPELLQLIFRFNLITPSGNRAERYIRTMVILRSVSWGWRALLDQSPFLWGHITSSDHPEFISEAVESSKKAPLHLKYWRRGGNQAHSGFLDKVFPHLHRWESISIHNPTQEVLTRYFTSRAPLLKRMFLSTSDEREPHDPFRPFSGSWTSLEELRIRWWREIDGREVQFGRLRVVEIVSCGSLEISLIFRLVRENQRLEILELEDITFTSSAALTHSNTPIVLSRLESLTLRKLVFADPSNVNSHPHDPTFHILRHIRFPSCTKFILNASIESESTIGPEDLRSLLPSPLDLLAHPSPRDPPTSQATMGYLSAAFSDHGFALTVDQGSRLKYKVKLDSTPRSITRCWLKSALEDRPGVTLQRIKLHVLVEEHSNLDELVAFQASEAVTQLSVEIRAEDLQEDLETRVLQILGTPCTSASGTTVMAFPRLLNVELDGWEVQGEAVVEMIKKRFSTPGVEAHRPNYFIFYARDWSQLFHWDDLDYIGGRDGFETIHFGAIDEWPTWSTRPRSSEAWWAPSGEDQDEGANGGDELSSDMGGTPSNSGEEVQDDSWGVNGGDESD